LWSRNKVVPETKRWPVLADGVQQLMATMEDNGGLWWTTAKLVEWDQPHLIPS